MKKMKCPLCNTHNDDGSEVCSRCGASLTEHKTEEQYFKKRSSNSILHILLILLIVFFARLLILFGARMIKKTVVGEESNPSYDITNESIEPVEWQQVKEDIDRQMESAAFHAGWWKI